MSVIMVVNEMASAAGLPCSVDPTLVNALRQLKNEKEEGSLELTESVSNINIDKVSSSSSSNDTGENPVHKESEYEIACLLFVFVAVSIPKLARADSSVFKAYLEGHVNNSHCLAKTINQLAGALFTIHGPGDVADRLQEFLALASSSLLRLGQENDKESTKNRESVYLLLDQIVQESPYLTMDLLESCFPYALLRNAYNTVYKASAAEV
ncbi:hypothetical protein KUTeg_022742 [Tegillarca granosa]|uniref:Uncharacterized protein n=1 Tax=Tegillarca granosa TaxID=220873 RepID=A0ABQ9E488_TEGGR|nr:hypothetical protein KUTeg_022742 [Tegillarca granosa]